MITQIGLVCIIAGWLVQLLKMKKKELNKWALGLYVLGVALLSYSGLSDGAITDMDVLELLSFIASGIVLIKIWK
ncbi:hypothetical protein COS64_01835 [archaeon CG06_land_8_20_14_3_00_37_11]|nr:MAG: hypothetical protein COS64_01835 [archaeon CG06_land_8_20_14_3_00_37_11]